MKNGYMTVLSVPVRLKLAVAALFLCIPLIATEVILFTRAPWWRLPYSSMGYWSLAISLICVPISVWLMGASKRAWTILTGLAAIWILTSVGLSIKMQFPPLGFFSILLLIFFTLELCWLKYELKRSFLDPQLTWYQRLPKPIPGLKCQVSFGEKSIDLKVSRIDREGVFVFSQVEREVDSSPLRSFLERPTLDLVFNFRERQIACQGIPTLSMGEGTGAGIQFQKISEDLRKEIGDFIEALQEEGYV